MATSKQKKQDILSEITSKLGQAGIAIFIHYRGLKVSDLRILREELLKNNADAQIVKNNLLKIYYNNNTKIDSKFTEDLFKGPTAVITGEDEAGVAKSLSTFAKDYPEIEFSGGINQDGVTYTAKDLLALASLPSKLELQAKLTSTIASPLTSLLRSIQGNLTGLLTVLEQHSNNLTK